MSKLIRKVLLALDFDHTIINNNSDTYIYKLAPAGVIPQDLKNLYRESGWTEYMGEIFKYLHKNGVKKEDILKCLQEIPLTSGMEELFSVVPKDTTELIIISDSNTVFINHILENKNFKDIFSAVFSNSANFQDNGCLSIEMYHRQNFCDLSTINLCKGDILAKYIESRAALGVNFSNVAYIGDGFNDFCPSLRLNYCDAVFPRVGFRLEETIPVMQKKRNLNITASVVPWKTGNDILNAILPWYSDIGLRTLPEPRLLNSNATV